MVNSVCDPELKICSGSRAVYQDLSTCHGWPVKKNIARLASQMEGNSEHTSGNSFRSLDYFCYPDYVIKGLTDGLIERLT